MPVMPGPTTFCRVSSEKQFSIPRHDHGCSGSTSSKRMPVVRLNVWIGKGSRSKSSRPYPGCMVGYPGGSSPQLRMLFNAVLLSAHACGGGPARMSSNVTTAMDPRRHHGGCDRLGSSPTYVGQSATKTKEVEIASAWAKRTHDYTHCTRDYKSMYICL